MKYVLFILALGSLTYLGGCKGRCDCYTPPYMEVLRFMVMDSSGNNLVTYPSHFNLYYMLDGNKVTVNDFTIFNNMAKDSLSEVTYLCESGQAVDRSAEGVREFYFELTPGDVDTVFMEAERQDEATRRITTVRFNGKEPERGDAGQAYSWLFVKEGK